MRACVLCLSAVAALAAASRADEIVFKDGTTVRCEIYRETEDYVHYIDPAKDMCCGASKIIIKEIRYEDEPVLDVEAFLERKAEALADEQTRELRELLARRAAEAGTKAKTPVETVKPDEGKLKFRPMTIGVEIVGDPGSDTPELIVDPFPEEDLKESGGETREKKKPTKKPRRRRRKTDANIEATKPKD